MLPKQQGSRRRGATSAQKQKPRRIQPRRGERDLGATPSEIGQKTCGKPEGLSYVDTERVGKDTCERLNAQKRGWARGVTWIAGRRRWSRYGESPRLRNVKDYGREDDCFGLPRRALRAVAVPRGVLCYKRVYYEPNLKLSCYPTAD